MTDKQLWARVKSLTLAEKAALCSGFDAWTTKPNAAQDIPRLRMADGPHGLRLEDPKNAKKNGGHSRPSTCFPPAVAMACSWNPALAKQVGQAIAAECKEQGVGMILGPGVNIKRSPLCGRNFEYFSEDPLLAGKMGAGFIQGVQQCGVAASLKHFAVNNQEEKRMSISAAVDDRALFDLYLKPFEIAIQEAQPATVMCSYNRVNGSYASESRRLLNNILRMRFGFTGAVISDWGAVNDRAAGILAGLDLEMPGSGGANDYAIQQAVQNGRLPVDALDTAVWNLLRLIFTYGEKPVQQQTSCNYKNHHQLAVKAALQSSVLLKNDGMLPLQKEKKVAVIGEMAGQPRYQGGGSSIVNPKQLVSFVKAMQRQNINFTYTPGYRLAHTTAGLIAQAVQAASEAEQVILFLGLPDAYECEGYDRKHLALPPSQLQLLDAVAAANPNLCVVLCCGAPVVMPWLAGVRALLCPHLGGEGVGEAVQLLLYGQANPAGKLAESWPLALEDTPCYHHFPMGPVEVSYNESIFVGYRYYDTANKEVLFPFGYGLSYTSYAYSNLTLVSSSFAKNEDVTVRFSLANTGKVAGTEIAQVYLVRKNSKRWQPAQELKGFVRVALEPGQQKSVSLTIPYKEFGFYDSASGSHVVEQGEYEIYVGGSSRSLPLSIGFTLQGLTLARAPAFSPTGFYGQIQNNRFPSEEFAHIYQGRMLGNAKVPKGSYTTTTPLGMMQESFWGRGILRLSVFVARRFIRFSKDPQANRHAGRVMAEDLPFKNLVLQTRSWLSPAAMQALLRVCNGKGGSLKFVRELLRKKPYRHKQ